MVQIISLLFLGLYKMYYQPMQKLDVLLSAGEKVGSSTISQWKSPQAIALLYLGSSVRYINHSENLVVNSAVC